MESEPEDSGGAGHSDDHERKRRKTNSEEKEDEKNREEMKWYHRQNLRARMGKSVEHEGHPEQRKPKTHRTPTAPTAEERRAHRVGHVHFQPWCRACVRAKAKDRAHGSREDVEGEERMAELHMDYCFMKDEIGGPVVTVLVGRQLPSHLLRAHVVLAKRSAPQGISERVAEDVRHAGVHGELMTRTDQENAIEELLKRFAEVRAPAKTVIEEAPKSDSKANGRAERVVQAVEEECRTILCDLEEIIGEKISVESNISPWIVEYGCDCKSLC